MREAPEQTLQGLWFCDLALCRRSGCWKVWTTPQAWRASGGTKDSHLYRGSAKAPMPWRMCLSVVLKIIQFSHSVMSDSATPWTAARRPPCPSPTPGVHANSCTSSRWCHPTISSSVIPFSSCPQSLPASGSFPASQLFTSGAQSIRVSASASVLPMNIQDWSPLGWTG